MASCDPDWSRALVPGASIGIVSAVVTWYAAPDDTRIWLAPLLGVTALSVSSACRWLSIKHERTRHHVAFDDFTEEEYDVL